MKCSELLGQVNPGELVLGVAEDGLPVKLDLKEALGPVFVIAQAESKTHELLMLTASSLQKSSPDYNIVVVTKNPETWQEINPDFVTTPDDPRLTEYFNGMISQPDTRRLLIVEGLEHSGQMPNETKLIIHSLLQNRPKDGNIQILASIDPEAIPGGINPLITEYLNGQLIWGITKTTKDNNLQPDEFLAAGLGQYGQALRFSLPES